MAETMSHQLTLVADIETVAREKVVLPGGYAARALTASDANAIAGLYYHAYPRTIAESLAAAREEIAATYQGDYGSLAPAASPVIQHGTEVVAAVMTVEAAPWPDTPPGQFVVEAIVHPDHRRRGLAVAAIRWMAQALSAGEERTVGLRVMSDNQAAKALYANLGFREWSGDNVWYHGSPEQLASIRAGSTITRDRELARVFSHKPSLVSQDIVGATRMIRHSGVRPGYLYRIAEEVGGDDAYPHPATTMGPGQEWLTRRTLAVELLEPTTVVAEESLTDDEIAALRRRASRPQRS